MGSRERKRVERRKRKRRSPSREVSAEAASPSAADPAEAISSDAADPAQESFQERLSRRSEQRNAEARASLEPLAEGERPAAVTVGAAISALIAVIFTASAVVAAIGDAEVVGAEPSPAPLALFAMVLWMMVWGMWKARYWAVLGFQMVLVLLILSTALGLVGAQSLSLLQAVGSLLLLAGLGALFYFMIKAMARIQMPAPPGRR
jgi:hypothetical protein